MAPQMAIIITVTFLMATVTMTTFSCALTISDQQQRHLLSFLNE
jgi:hypothetical protein